MVACAPSLGIGESAFADCKCLKSVSFGTRMLRTRNGRSWEEGQLLVSVFEGSGLESVVLPRTLRVVRKNMFLNCKHLKSIGFGEDSELEEIELRAFYGTGLESFVAPPRLKKIDAVVFGNCRALKRVSLNRDIEELGFLCFWATTIEDVTIPLQTRMTPQLLGLD